MDIDTLKAEHAALLGLRMELLALLDDNNTTGAQIATVRWRFSRVLLGHLAREDNHLYPLLKADSNTGVAKLAEQYEREMGGLAPQWQAFMTDWPSDRITAEWSAFKQVAKTILGVLEQRIKREERDLYPRYDALLARAPSLPRAG